MVSIVIVTFNDEQAVRRCVDSIYRHTRTPYEIIVVNNGSRDGTFRYLNKNSGIHLISNGKNVGLPRALNQGLESSRGEFLLKLDNDVVVTPGWLEKMLACLERDPNIGLIGPLSNVATRYQLFEKSLFSFIDRDYFVRKSEKVLGRRNSPLKKMAAYQNEKGLEGFYRRHFLKRPVQFKEVPFLSGFCMLMPRRIFCEIGPFDERFRFAGFDDFDYSLRVSLAGYKVGIAKHVYIHHEGSRSFYRNSLSLASILSQNAKRFLGKWNRVPPARQLLPAMLNVYHLRKG